MRLLIAGSRDWTDGITNSNALRTWWNDAGQPDHPTLATGNCPTGADLLCAAVWESRHWPVERHSADWKQHGKAAGPIRNQHMVNLGADHCIAFIRNNSRGATHTANAAETAGIPTTRYTA